jgi:Mce-associated membrane protein
MILRVTVAGLAMFTVAVVAAGTLFFLQVRCDSAQDRLRAEAADVAAGQAVSLLTVNGQNVEGKLASLARNATWEFRREFPGIAKNFGAVVRQGKVDSTGRVESAAVDKLTADTARVQLALSSSATNARTALPQTRHYRITVDLERKENRWLVAGMRFVP